MSEKKPEPKAAAPSKGGGKLVAIGAVALIALGGGGGAFWYFTRAAHAAPKAAAHHKQAKDGEEEEEEEPETVVEADGIVSLDPFLVNLADAGGSRFLRATLKLVVADEKKAEKISKNPAVIGRARSAILELLTVQTSDKLITAEGKAELRKQIRKRVSPLMGGVKVSDVLFADFVVQF